MLHYPILIENLIEDVKRPAAFDHVVFRDDLEPIYDRLLLEDVLVVRYSQSDSYAIVGEAVEAIGGRREFPLVARSFKVWTLFFRVRMRGRSQCRVPPGPKGGAPYILGIRG